jgi:hypothetical protein
MHDRASMLARRRHASDACSFAVVRFRWLCVLVGRCRSMHAGAVGSLVAFLQVPPGATSGVSGNISLKLRQGGSSRIAPSSN